MTTTLSCNIEDNLEEVRQNADIKAEAKMPTAQTRNSPLPEDVTCDSCMDSPSKAVKSCLTCLVSYCDVHLRPHLENSKFQSHRLVRPRHEIDGLACEAHKLPLERFCVTDGCCVCLECESHGHEGHTVSLVGEARAQIETELQLKQEAIGHSTSAAEKTIKKLQSNSDLMKSSVQDICVVVEQEFDRVQTAVTEARKEAMAALESEQRQAVRQAEGIQAHLEQRRTELMKTLAQINKLFRIKSDADFLQEYAEWKKGATDVHLPGVYINRMDQMTSYVRVLTDSTQELCDLIGSFYRDKLGMLCKDGIKSPMAESHMSSLVDPKTREEFFTYAESLTFDPDTTHHFLRVTEDNGKLTNTSPWQHSYPDHPDRFEYWRQAMTLHSVYLGRHYIEAELSGEGAHVGVTYKSIDRKGEQSSCCITGNDFCWCVGRNSRGFFAWHAGQETALEVSDVKRIGMFVDFHRGAVSFYDVTGAMRLLHRYQADFIEPLYVIVWLSKTDNAVSLVNAT